MKMQLKQLLIGNLILILLYSCQSDKFFNINISERTIITVEYFDGNKIKTNKLNNIKSVVEKINNSHKIQGHVIGTEIKNLNIITGINPDTIKITVFGKENKLFKIGNHFYESSISLW